MDSRPNNQGGPAFNTDDFVEPPPIRIAKEVEKIPNQVFGSGLVRWCEERQLFFHGGLMTPGCGGPGRPAVLDRPDHWNMDEGVPHISTHKTDGKKKDCLDANISSYCVNNQPHQWQNSGRRRTVKVYVCGGHSIP